MTDAEWIAATMAAEQSDAARRDAEFVAATIDAEQDDAARRRINRGAPWATLDSELVRTVTSYLFYEGDPRPVVALTRTCHSFRRDALSIAFECLDLLIVKVPRQLGLLRAVAANGARLRSMRLCVGSAEGPMLMRWLATTCDLSQLRVLQLRVYGTTPWAIVDAHRLPVNDRLHPVDLTGADLSEDRRDQARRSQLEELPGWTAAAQGESFLAQLSRRATQLHTLGLVGSVGELGSAEELARLGMLQSLRVAASDERYGLEGDRAWAKEDLEAAIPRLANLQKLTLLGGHHQNIRITSNSLRTLDMVGVDKACWLTRAACPRLTKIYANAEIIFCASYGSGAIAYLNSEGQPANGRDSRVVRVRGNTWVFPERNTQDYSQHRVVVPLAESAAANCVVYYQQVRPR
mmetsp:Transcript_4697/g.14971  ORF Transcript_4697/g.14971 Transcript_4697/m.14971 type:complete len:406 (+) Transcript_4697:317-1534(+)